MHWAERTLSARRFGMKGWSSTVELEKDFSQWSQELNLLLTLGGRLSVGVNRGSECSNSASAMGGELETTVTEGCPAFADGCPYGKNVEVAEWIKERRELSDCPAFKDGPPGRMALKSEHFVEISAQRPLKSKGILSFLALLQHVSHVRCPFTEAGDMAQLQSKLEALPASHGKASVAERHAFEASRA